jgi:hypothetical protein
VSAAAEQLSREDLVAIAWQRGNLAWKLRPEQRLLKTELEYPHVQLVVMNIARRFGKTFTLVNYALEQAQKQKQKIRYGCAFLTDLEEFVLPAFYQELEDCPEALRPKYIRTRKTWVFPNGSEIKLVGLDKNPNGLRGNAINIIIIDEAGFVANLKHVYTSVIVPATAKQKNIKIIFISTPPESPDHYFVELIQKAQTQPNGYYACLTIDDISDLDPRERQRLLDEVGGEHSTAAQREFFCRIIVDATRAICPEFDAAAEADIVKPIQLPQFYRTWFAGDLGGVQDKTVAYLCAYDFERGKVLFLSESAHGNQTPTSAIVAGFRAMEATAKVPITRRHLDGPGQLLTDLRVDYNYLASLPDKEDFDAGLNQLRVAVLQRKIEIDPSCKLLIMTLKMGMLNKQRTDYMRTEALGHCDAVAGAIYAYRHRLTENPIPPLLGKHREHHATWNASEEEINRRHTLAKAFTPT